MRDKKKLKEIDGWIILILLSKEDPSQTLTPV